jgi:carbon-monoxide dehydrogenase medium subunit
MKLFNNFYYPSSVEEALHTLGQTAGVARALAGGTDLLLDLQQGRHSPVDTLVDITNIPELKGLEIRANELFIGATVPIRKITTSPLVRDNAIALAEASGLIGGPQVRNVATLGGNVAHALPAADGTIALMALNARAEIASLKSRQLMPMSSLFKGPGISALDPKGELLVGFYLPTQKAGQASAFKRIMRPQGVAIAILNCSIWLQREEDAIEDIRISFGPSGPTPRRLEEVENLFRGQIIDDKNLKTAHSILLEEVSFRTSRHRSTQAYREEMAGVLLKDTLMTAWNRSGA